MAQSVRRGLSREAEFSTALKDVEPTFKILRGVGLSSEEVREALQPLPDIIEGLTEAVLTGIEVLDSILQLVQDAIEILAIALGTLVDLFEALVLSAIEVLETVKNFFVGTSISTLVHFPRTHGTKRNLNEILYDVGMAFLDVNDDKRPIANRTSTALSIIVMWTGLDLSNIQQLFKRLMALLKGFPLDFDPDVGLSTYGSDEFKKTGAAVKPNFNFNASLADIPAVKKLVEKLDELIALLSVGKTFADILNSIINAVLARVQRIRDIITEILNAIANLLALFALGEGQNIVSLQGKGTNEDFARVIINLPNDPEFPSASLGTVPDKKLATQLDKNVFLKNTFSGAALLHLQVGEGGSDQKLEAIRRLLMKDVPERAREDLKQETDDIKDNPVVTGRIRTGWTQVRRGDNA